MSGREMQFGVRITADGRVLIDEFKRSEQQVENFGKKVEQSSRQAAAAMRMLPAQMTDIAVGLSSGQSPFMVLMQQGGQLKDVFGGIGPAARAVGGYVMGLINPVTLAAGAVAGLAVAYQAGQKESEGLARSIILTNNAAATSVGQLQAIAATVSATTSATRGAVAEVLEGLVGTGKVAAGSLAAVAEAAVLLERNGVQSIDATVKQMAELGKAPVEASLKLNEQYRYLTLEVYRQIKALEDQGRTEEAAAVAQKAYAGAMGERAKDVQGHLGLIERTALGVKDAFKSMWDAALDVGREDGLDVKLAKAKAALEQVARERAALDPYSVAIGAAGKLDSRAARLETEIAGLDILIEMERQRTAAKREADKATQDQIKHEQDWSDLQQRQSGVSKAYTKDLKTLYDEYTAGGLKVEEYRARVAKLIATETEIGRARKGDGRKAAAPWADEIRESQRLAAEMDKLRVKAAAVDLGVSPKTLQSLEDLDAAYAAGIIPTFAEYQTLLGRIIDADEVMTQEEKDKRQAIEEGTRATEAYLRPLEEQAAAMEREVELYGLTRAQIELTAVARLEEARAVAAANGAWPEHLAFLDREIAARKRLANAASSKDRLDEEVAFWKSLEGVGHQTWNSLADGAKSFWQRAKESGQNIFAEWLYQLSVQKIFVQIVTSVSGAGVAQQVFGAAAVNGGGGGNLLSWGSNASGAHQAYTGFTTGGGTGFWGSAGNWAGNAFGAYGTAGSSTNVGALNYVNSFDSGAMGSTVGMDSGAASIGWMAAIPLLAFGIAEWLGSREGGTKIQADSFVDLGPDGVSRRDRWVGGGDWYSGGEVPDVPLADLVTAAGYEDLAAALDAGETVESLRTDYLAAHPEALSSNDALAAVFTPVAEGVGAFVSRLGGDAAGLSLGLGYSTDPRGTAPDQVSSSVADAEGNIIYGRTRDVSRGSASQELATETKRLTLGAVDAADINPVFEAIVHGIDIASASAEQLDKALADLAQAASALDLAEMIGLDAAGREALVGATEDLAGLTGGMAQYYDLFFTEEEKRARATADLAETFTGLNLTMPTTKEGFRAIVESLDLTTESGRTTFNALMKLGPAFAQVTNSATTAATTVAQTSAQQASWAEATARAQASVATAAIEGAREAARAWQQMAADLRGYLGELGATLTGQSPESAYNAAHDAWRSTANRAALGDQAAMASLRQVSDAYLEASRGWFGSSAGYWGAFGDVQAAVQAAIGTADRTSAAAWRDLRSGRIPGFATGGTAEGWFMAGEAGPELIYSSSPVRVLNNTDSRAVMDAAPIVDGLRAVEMTTASVGERLERRLAQLERRLEGIEAEARLRSAA